MDVDWDNLEPENQNPENQAPSAPEYDEYDEFDDDLDDDDPASAAIRRIEQAKLYELLLTHDFFTPGSARAEIQDKVTDEIRDFILDRLNALVGISPPKEETTLGSDLWDDDQIGALTAMANKLLSKRGVNKPATSAPSIQHFSDRSAAPTVPSVQAVAPPKVKPPTPPAKKRKPRTPRKGKSQSSAVLPPSQDAVEEQPVSNNGVTLYKTQVVSKKNPPKTMPSQAEQDMINAKTATRNQAGAGADSQLLSLAISGAQDINRNIVEED